MVPDRLRRAAWWSGGVVLEGHTDDRGVDVLPAGKVVGRAGAGHCVESEAADRFGGVGAAGAVCEVQDLGLGVGLSDCGGVVHVSRVGVEALASCPQILRHAQP